jgi:hypothetical protein
VNRTRSRLRQNEANLLAWTQTDTGRGSHRRRCRSGILRQTNPICRRRVEKTIAKARGLDAATREGANASNKANFTPDRPAEVPPTEDKRAKQTQFAPGAQEWAPATGTRRPRRGLIVRNEANHRQSLPPRRRGMPMPQAYPTLRAIAPENSLASNAAGG